MQYLATALLAIMTIALVLCGALLWKHRKETNDLSRTIQAVFSWLSAFFTLTFIFRTWAETTTVDGAFFEPEHTFVPLLMQMSLFLYPLEVMRPTISRTKVYALLFSPLLLLVCVGMCGGIDYTPIHTYADLWAHIGEFNVWFRLFALTVMLFYCFALFLVPYDWRKSSASKRFIGLYASCFCLIGLFHFAIQMSHAYLLVLLHQVAWITTFVAVTYYELRVRLSAPSAETKEVVETPETPDPDPETETETAPDKLWMRIEQQIDANDGWRNPDLTLTMLAQQVFSNRTYVSEAFKRNTGLTFGEWIAKRRIDFVVEALRHDPQQDVKELFHHVGFRSRTAAWTNFRKETGLSPADFLANLS